MAAMVVPPAAYEISGWARRLGLDDPLPYLTDFALIDTDALRRIGMEVWGIGHPPGGEASGSAHTLHATAEDLNQGLRPLAQDWQDTAYVAFERHIDSIREALAEETSRMAPVGQALVSIADEFDIRWYEIAGYVISAYGLLMGIIGAALSVVGVIGAAATGGTSLALAVGGLVISLIGVTVSIVGLAVTYLSSVLPRLEELAAAQDRIGDLATAPSALDG